VTDFFGGVSSVEVMRKEGMLPVLGRKVGKWEEVGKRKEIGGEGASTGWEVRLEIARSERCPPERAGLGLL